MPYTKRQLLGDRRDKDSDGLMWRWGEAVKHGWHKGHAPADPDTPRLAVHFGPRLPCDDWYLDLCRAFAALHPATLNLGNTGSLAWYAHASQIGREQEAIWLYYVEGFGLHQFRRDFRQLTPARRDTLLDLWQANPGAYSVEDTDGDGLVAARVGCHPRTAQERRLRGVGRMVAFLNPPRRCEDAA